MTIICRYGEIFLKGLNRPQFERALVTQIKRKLGSGTVRSVRNRIFVDGCDAQKLQTVFGLSSLSSAIAVPIELDEIAKAALSLLLERKFTTFCIAAQRITKTGGYSSAELNIAIGDAIRKATNGTVNLDNPDVTIGIEIINDTAYVFTERLTGPGGLPVGVSGMVTVWMDDPYAELAALLMCKRGCTVRGAGTVQRKFPILSNYISDFDYVAAPFESFSPIVRGTLAPEGFNIAELYPLIGMTADDADERLSYYAHLY